MQRYEFAAWLGDNHGLTEDQVEAFDLEAADIHTRYYTGGHDADDDIQAALTVAHRVLVGDPGVLDDLAKDLLAARIAEARALAGIRQAAKMLIPSGEETESGFARRLGVDRMAVRGWLGKR